MKKTFEVDIWLTPEELAQEIWDLPIVAQAIFLNDLSLICKNDFPSFAYMLEDLSDELNTSAYNKQSIINMLEKVLEYLKEQNNEQSNEDNDADNG